MDLNKQTLDMVIAEKEYDETVDETIQRLVRMNRLFFKCHKKKDANGKIR